MNKTTPEEENVDFKTPFENIALAFSGGGFRAATYSLGILSYLNSVEFFDTRDQKTSLLKKVSYLSSASGGTIATATYTLYSVQGKSFDEYYAMLYKALEGDYILNETLRILNTPDEWKKRPHKTRNLINAFALAYDKHLFDGMTVNSLLSQNGNTSTHLSEVCFNATEFYRGLLFRQQVKLQPDTKDDRWFLFGNFVINLNHEAAKHIKLADMLAASSCFPGGFEPIIFPNDFSHDKYTPAYFIKDLNLKLQSGGLDELKFLFGEMEPSELKKNREILLNDGPTSALQFEKLPKIGFMDGGITDNQGLESMMRAHERRQKAETSFLPFDLMLVNDVGSHFMDSYELPEINLKKLFSSWSIKTWMILLTIGFIAGVYGVSFITKAEPNIWERVAVIAGSVTVTITGVVLGLLVIVITKLLFSKPNDAGLNLNKNFAHGIVKTLVRYFTGSPIRVLMQMVKTRLSSFLILNNDVFLKRIRKLLYDRFYLEPEWKLRGKANHVYDLSLSNNINRLSRSSNCPPYMEPSTSIQIVAENAFSMATTLWFDKARSLVTHKQACLVACGQFTTCYNLLEYILNLEDDKIVFGNLSDDYKSRIAEIKEKLKIDYENFKVDPFFMYNKTGQKLFPEFVPLSVDDIPFPANFKGL
jgi:hypothetical protein